MRPSHRAAFGVLLSLAMACGLPRQDDLNLAQQVAETTEVLQAMQEAQLDLNDRIDSLARVVQVQDSLIRMIANLSGNPLPPR
ncbi:MAG: hypothetical protein JNJ98_15675 [Gemmatimonadetes bacterium]|nr:hypothetical protein [Gemmatimonadota bacterium]